MALGNPDVGIGSAVGIGGAISGGAGGRNIGSSSSFPVQSYFSSQNGGAAYYSLAGSAGPSTFIIDGSNRTQLIADQSGNSGVNCLCENGLPSANNASTPDSVALSVTGDIDLRVFVSLPNWNPGAFGNYFITKWGASGHMSYLFDLNGSNQVRYICTSDGSTSNSYHSSATVSLTNFTAYWLRVTYAAASGDVFFYTSTDGITWTQLGTKVTGSAGAIFDSDSPVRVGGVSTDSSTTTTGNYRRAQIYNGIAGTLVFDANFATATKLASTFTESSSNAATVTINTSGDLGARISGERDLVQLTQSKQPIYLPYSGTKYGYLNGTSGNYVSSPDSAPLEVAGSIDLRAQVSMTSWTTSGQSIISKWNNGTNKCSYRLYLNTAGAPAIDLSPDGINGFTATSSAATPFAAGATGWVRATFNLGTLIVQFFTSTDGVSWSQLGSNQSMSASVTAIFQGNAPLELGSVGGSGATALMAGNMYRAQIYNGIAGTLVFDANFQTYSSGSTFTESSTNAATVTVNNGAAVVKAPGAYFDGSTAYVESAPFSYAQPESVYLTASQLTWTSTHSLTDGTTANGLVIGQKNGGSSGDLIVYAGGAAGRDTVNLGLHAMAVARAVFNGTSSSLGLNLSAAVADGNSPGSNNGNGFTIGGLASGSGLANMVVSEAVLRNGADTAQTQLQIAAYEKAKFGF